MMWDDIYFGDIVNTAKGSEKTNVDDSSSAFMATV